MAGHNPADLGYRFSNPTANITNGTLNAINEEYGIARHRDFATRALAVSTKRGFDASLTTDEPRERRLRRRVTVGGARDEDNADFREDKQSNKLNTESDGEKYSKIITDSDAEMDLKTDDETDSDPDDKIDAELKEQSHKMSLNPYMNKRVIIITVDGRTLAGTLLSCDQTTNLVLQNTVERNIRTIEDPEPSTEVIHEGFYVVRGDNVVMAGLVNEELDASIDWTKVKGNHIRTTKNS